MLVQHGSEHVNFQDVLFITNEQVPSDCVLVQYIHFHAGQKAGCYDLQAQNALFCLGCSSFSKSSGQLRAMRCCP